VTNWLTYTGGFPPTYEKYRQMLDEADPHADSPNEA